MAGCGRRLAVRAGAASFAAVFGLASTVLASEAATKQLTITVQVGYHNTVRLGQWMPVTVDLTNNGQDVEGTLEVQASTSGNGNGGPPIGAAVYQTPLSLAAGATKHVRTYLTQDNPGTVAVRVIQNGHVLASQEARLPSIYSGVIAGIISDQPSALDNLGIIRTGLSPLVVHLSPAEVADSAPALRFFDLIAIDDFATDTLTGAQRDALTDYVLQGGALLLGTGGSWHKTVGGLPPSLLPMQITGSRVLASLPALGAERVEVATGTVSAGSTVWLAQGDQPLLVEATVGAGVVELATFDWTQDTINGANANPVLRQAFVRSTYGNATGQMPGGPVVSKFGSTTSIANKGGVLANVLGNLPSLNLPAWWLIGALVLVYVLLVGPVNYFVLRALNRRALAWLTVPAIALVGSVGAYGASVATKGTAVLANEISILHVQQGWERAYQEEYTGILTPSRGDYEVGVGGGRRMFSPIYYYSGTITDPNFGAMRVNTTTQAVTLPGMTAFTLRGFANEGTVAAPQLAGSSQLTGGKLVGTIRNLSSLHFTDGIVMSANSYQTFGELGPNGTVSFSYQVSGGSGFLGQPVYVSAYPSALNGNPITNASDVERENEMRTSVLGALMGNGPVTTVSVPTVVLWSKQPFQAVTVNGGRPRTFSESAVVLTLPIGTISGSLPSSLVTGRMVDIDADVSQSGLPGLLAAQSGSITYSFRPTLAPGKHLSSAAIDSSNPFGPKGVIASNGAPAFVKGQVWDWSKSSWIDIGYQDNSSMPIPDSAVNPTTGEVRLKLSSDGSFSSTWLSLSGAVA